MSNKIYVGQTALIIRVTTGIDLSTASAVQIKYKKPDGTTGAWTGTVYNETRGIISYTIASASDLDQEGDWIAWAYVTFTGGTVAPGNIFKFHVYTEGE